VTAHDAVLGFNYGTLVGLYKMLCLCCFVFSR